jgi:hypothetical protein
MTQQIRVTTLDGFVHYLESAEAISAIVSINTRNAVQAAHGAGNSETYTPPEPEPEPPAPNWDGFNAAILADVPLNVLLGAVLALSPAVALGVPVSLGQVAKEGTASFAIAFTALCELGDATTEAREAWGVIAEAHNLPPDFVAIVRGA